MSADPLYLTAGIAGLLSVWLAAKKVNQTILDQTTCVPDLANIGKPTKSKYSGRAVVCGGSYAGLMTAKMLTDHFDEVIVIESEATFEDGGRKGLNVMQYNQLHGAFSFEASPFMADWYGVCSLWNGWPVLLAPHVA